MVTEFATELTQPDRPYSILVADDDAGSRETIASVLAGCGFDATTATSGEEAIEIVRVRTVDLVVFDHQMPRMTGLEALEQVRLFNALLPALLVTADPTADVIRQARHAHVYSVLPKPVNASLFLHMLRRALSAVYGPRPA